MFLSANCLALQTSVGALRSNRGTLKVWETELQPGRKREFSKPTIRKNNFKIEEHYVTEKNST